MKLSLIIPLYNEEPHLEDVFKNLASVNFSCDVEYIIVDDCSTDNSLAVAKQLASQYETLKVFAQSKNQGKGAALRRGFREASGDIIVVQDADFEYSPHDLPGLIQPILDDKADVVYGSRFHKSGHQVHRTFHYLVNRFLTILSNLLSGLYLSDMETCYKVFRREIIMGLELESNRFGFEPEVTAKLAKLKLRIEERPIQYFPRNYDQGKKISWKDGVAAIWFILKYNLQRQAPYKNSCLPQKYIANAPQWL